MVNKAMSNTPMYPISMIVSYFIDYWRVGAASRCQLSWAHGLLLWDSDGQRKTNLLVCGVLVCPARLRGANWPPGPALWRAVTGVRVQKSRSAIAHLQLDLAGLGGVAVVAGC
jgi:hypothetical protein